MKRRALLVLAVLLAACAPAGTSTPTATLLRPTATQAPPSSTPVPPSPTPSETSIPANAMPDDMRNLAAFSAENIEGIFEVASLEIGVDISDIAFVPVGGGYSLWVATWEQDSRLENWNLYFAYPVSEMAVGDIFAPKSLSASADGSLLATADEDDVQLWDAVEEALIPFEFEPSPWLEEALIAPDNGNLLAVGYSSADGTLALIDLETGEDVAVFRHGDYVTDIDFSSDGRYLASGSANGSVKVIDVTAGEETFPYEETGLVDSVALEASPPGAGATGDLLAISASGAISLWDGATGELNSVLGGHGSEVSAMDFSPNGELLVSGGRDGELKIWDVVTGEEMASYDLRSEIRRVVFSPDGTLLAATTLEGPVWVWAAGEE
jgi:WD40 repeat protein